MSRGRTPCGVNEAGCWTPTAVAFGIPIRHALALLGSLRLRP